MIRVVLWGAGALAGLALLGVSIWVALAVRHEPDQPAPVVASAASPSDTVGGSEAESSGMTQAGAGEGAGVAPVPAAAAGGEADAAPSDPSHFTGGVDVPAPASGSTAPPTPQPPPSTAGTPNDAPRAVQSGGLAVGSTSPLLTAPKRAVAAPKPPASTPKRSPAPTKVAPPHGEPTAASSKPVPARTGAATPSGSNEASPTESDAGPGATELAPILKKQPLWPTTDEAPATKPRATPPPVADAARETSRVATPETLKTAAPAAPPAPAPGPTVAPAPPQGEPAATRPIDRLHLATQTAAAAEDVVSLRKLKTAWKNFIKAGAGPDRARAKREYADCLWGIQELTNRQSDQREALAAYREYVLSAPAGGTDARSVSRMRYLEDVLSEAR